MGTCFQMFSNARQSAYRKSRGQRSLGFSGGLVSLPEPDGGTKYASGGRAGRNERWRENRAVFADLILTTCPGRVLPWNRFATAAVVYTGGGRVGRDVQEGSERAGERAFCNTTSRIYQTARKRGETHGGGGHWNEAVGSERGGGGGWGVGWGGVSCDRRPVHRHPLWKRVQPPTWTRLQSPRGGPLPRHCLRNSVLEPGHELMPPPAPPNRRKLLVSLQFSNYQP